MYKSYSKELLRDEISRIISGQLMIRRSSMLSEEYENDIPSLDTNIAGWDKSNPVVRYLISPPQEDEIDEFIMQCPFDEISEINLQDFLLDDNDQDEIVLSDEQFKLFQKEIISWSEVNSWLAGDDHPIAIYSNELVFTSQFMHVRRTRYDFNQIHIPETKIEIGQLSPSFSIIEAV